MRLRQCTYGPRYVSNEQQCRCSFWGLHVSSTIDLATNDIPAIREPTLILVINQAYVSESSPAEVFEAARGHWRVGLVTRTTAQLVLGVADGIVRGVFRPSSWFPSPIAGQEGRWGFEGAASPEDAHLVGTSVARLPVRKGASNPVRRYLDGIPASGAEGPALEAQWELDPGDYLGRQERQDLFGGATMGGIQPSNESPNVFLYSDPARGHSYGYNFDGWNADGSVFFYTGEGRTGDQRLRVGNRAIRDHALKGRALRLFVADGFEPGSRTARQRYLGQFDVDPEDPFEIERSSDENGDARSVIVFRLLPIGGVPVSERDRSATPLAEVDEIALVGVDEDKPEFSYREIDIEIASSSRSAHEVKARIAWNQRREAALVGSLRNALVKRDHEVHRQQITPAGQASPIYTDLFDATDNVLYEAKSDNSRESIRMAIGQLLDYRRFLSPEPRLAVLLPSQPARDLQALLRSVDVQICCPELDGSFQF